MKHVAPGFLVALALGLTLLWPGDATWLSDEPRLIAEAWHANHDHELARGGLWGNFGIRYGPLPTWIYQVLLLFTHDPVTLLALRALLCAGATAAGLLWLGRELRLPAWFVAAILAGPFVVQFHRVLWDASFAVPLGALTLAAFAHFLRTASGRTLALTIAGTFLLPTIHPQSLPLALPLLGWLAWKQRPALHRHWKPLGALVLVLLATHARWMAEAVFGFAHNIAGTVSHGYPDGSSRLICMLAPLLGGNFIGGLGSVAQVPSGALRAMSLGLAIVYPLAWFGSFVAARRCRGDSPRAIVGAVALAGLAVQAVLFGLMRIPSGPQYFFGTFALHAFLVWLAVDALGRRGAICGAVFGVSAALVTIGMALTIHQRGYDPALDWPTLKSQVAVARALNSFTDATAGTDVAVIQRHPQMLRTLRLLLPPDQPQRESGRIFITRARADAAEIELHESSAPKGTLIDITPLPKGWQPAGW
ncbi:MAG: hypothetical protein ABMA13_18435 [Chthoniobacteraceae bacterium]